MFDVGNEFGKPQALKGIRWLSATMYIFTPHSVANLAELGAEVIKIEMPRMGDPIRHTSPFNEAYLYPLHDSRPMTGTGFGFLGANDSEYHITMDYHLEEMKEAFYRLVKMSDGLTECYRPGTFDRWKQSYRYLQEMNPRFIYVWGGGFGYGRRSSVPPTTSWGRLMQVWPPSRGCTISWEAMWPSTPTGVSTGIREPSSPTGFLQPCTGAGRPAWAP